MNAHQTPAQPFALTAGELAAFIATLAPTDPLYWPALAAADGCNASLAELNAMLEADDCCPFPAASTVSPTVAPIPLAFEARDGEGSNAHRQVTAGLS